MAKIVYDRKNCIGAGECEVLSKIWKLDNKGKADLKGAILNENTGCFELEISDEMLKEQQRVAGSCPAGCIRIMK
ncbi:ferredoxin [Candidatus Woesearchaeota archaeon]|nr:ferredoxin [Candidatus Woesearchaeota archaeon]